MTSAPVVLVVDDKEENVYYLQSLLQGNGFVVNVACQGADALAMARQSAPALVVSDLLMPVMDGYSLLRHWKADPSLRSIPFLIYTGTYVEQEDERLAFDLGADDFLVKPLEPEALMQRVRAALSGAARPGPADVVAPADPPPDLFKSYSAALVRKLEEKTLQLTEANRALVHEKAEMMIRERAINAVSQGIIITDATRSDNPIIYASPGFERMTGFSAAETLGRNCRFLQGKDTDPETVKSLHERLEAGQECNFELLNYRKDGTPFWNGLSISPVMDEAGKVISFVGVQADVTQRRELESQLRQAQKMEAIGQLAAGVAHDFNNILSVILGYSSFLVEDLPESNPMRADIEQMRRAADRAKDLTQQLLAFSRLQVLSPRVIDLGQEIVGMKIMLTRMIGEDIEIKLLDHEDTGHVLADPTQIEQILMNLALNARDAMPEGGRLTIETTNVDLDGTYAQLHYDVTPGEYVMIAVTDTGTGMDNATKERVFEPFFTTKEKTKGTGLGLATVFGIVKQSGGNIWVYSEPGHGTTFKIYLPRISREVDAPLAPSTLAVSRGTETVLVVEDDEQVRAITSRTLQRFGYSVLEAANAGEALLICENYKSVIHLLLTDVVMPRMGGKQLADRLALLRPAMKVIFVSGYTETTIVHRGVLAQGVAFVPKPIVPDILLRKIRELLDAPPSDAPC